MHPEAFHLLGLEIGSWNLLFAVGIVAGYAVLCIAGRRRPVALPRPRWLEVRYLFVVYLCAVGAQLFAYAFDLHTSLLPQGSQSALRYYLDPVTGPKTLYGAVIFLPVATLLAWAPWRDVRLVDAADCLTPTLFAVLGFARLGCFIQGCCYGIASQWFGMRFAVGSPVYFDQLRAGSIAPGATPLAVLPAQLAEGLFLFGLCAWALRRLAAGRRQLMPAGIAAYSIFRFAIEFARADVERNHYALLSTSQWIALALLAALALHAWRGRAVAHPT